VQAARESYEQARTARREYLEPATAREVAPSP
jgi:hypothetical protein